MTLNKILLKPAQFRPSVVSKTGWVFLRSRQCALLSETNVRQKSSADAPSVSDLRITEEYAKAKPFSAIPGPKGLPVVGRWLDYKRHPWKIDQRHIYIQELRDKYGDIVQESFAGQTVLHLMNPEFIKKVYETEGLHPHVPPLLPSVKHYRQNHDMSPGLGNMNGEMWYKLRTVAQKVMVRPRKVLDFLYLQNEVADDFMSLLPSLIGDNGEVDDLTRWLLRWGVETSFNVFLEKRMGFLSPQGLEAADKLIDKTNAIFEISTKLWFSLPFYKYFQTPSFKRFNECEDYTNMVIDESLHAAAQEYQDQIEGRNSNTKKYLFLSYMLSPHISWKDFQSISASVLTDTLSTTVRALLFNLYTLANNPDAQEKAYQEGLTILTPSGELTVEGFNTSQYIKACMKETFRFFPIGLDVQRLAPPNLAIEGYQVPEGTYICLENYVPLQDPTFIPDPDLFLPDRWLRDSAMMAKVKEHPYILIPFSIGTRMCLGRRFAEQEMVLMIARILRDYRIEWHHNPLDQKFQLLQVPSEDVKVKFVPRNTQ